MSDGARIIDVASFEGRRRPEIVSLFD
jgi:hypothetical protein